MKNKYLKMLLVSSLSVFLLFGCGSKEEAPKESSTQSEQAEKDDENEPVKPVITDSITLDNESEESSTNTNETDNVDDDSTSSENSNENENSTTDEDYTSDEDSTTSNEDSATDDNSNGDTYSNESSNTEEESENLTSENTEQEEEYVNSDSESEEINDESSESDAPVALLDEVVISKVQEAISTIFNTDYSDKSNLNNIDSYINNNFIPEAKEKMLSKLSEYSTKISFSDLSITSVKKIDSLDERYPYCYDVTYNITVNKDKPSIFNDITATAFSDENGNIFFQSLNFGEF